ncbi:DUF6152 family protein [Viridibacterium curvum]|uniref:DUF6152 family protein n=1 Tax=Viridibacterium curvum TaxID=1101404 RepID=A0ABP9QUE6_9RHOO
MQRRQFVLSLPAIAAAPSMFLSQPLWAHHGWSSFDETRPLYLAGKATRVRWQNPHAELVLDVSKPLAVPASLKSRLAPRQSATVDAPAIFAKAVVPTRSDARWTIELSPLTRLQAWSVAEISEGDMLELVGYTFAGEKGEAILRVEFLIRGEVVTPLRSSPA